MKSRLACLFLALIILVGCSSASTKAETSKPQSNTSSQSDAISKPDVNAAAPVPKTEQQIIAERAEEILNGMTTKQKVAQMFLAHYPEANSAEIQAENQYGGYILFAKDFDAVPKSDMIATIKACQDASKIKMIIGVDEEGGAINRVSSNPDYRATPFKSPQRLYNKGGIDAIVAESFEKAELLKSVGINLNLAPVCDVSTNPNDYIYYRTLGQDAKTTADYISKVVTAMNEQKIGSTLKHFPGYGNNIDTHTGIARDNRTLDTFNSTDFLPFIAGIKSGAGSVLVSHNIVQSMDEVNPASLSPKVHEILREDLGFDGVIMTDDLYMGAIQEFTKGKGAAVTAILAGNDFLCCANSDEEIQNVLAAIEDGEIRITTVNSSVLRILKWKLNLNIIN